MRAMAAEDADPGVARYTQQATPASVPAPAQTKAKKSRLRQRPAREAKAAADDARGATWAPLLCLEREASAAADAARAASGGGVDMGHGEESEESEKEHDAWRTYYEIYDNYFDYDL